MNKRHLISNNNNKLHQRNYKSTPSLRRSITTKRPSTTSSTIKPFKSNRKISSRKTRDDSIITNNNKRKSGLPPTFRSYTQNLKADLIYAKFHVRNVKGARERRHIDQARRARMFQIQLLRERNRKEKIILQSISYQNIYFINVLSYNAKKDEDEKINNA